jgi:hypothetical protein
MTNIFTSISFSHLFQPIIVGIVLAWYTVELIASIKATKKNGRITIFGCGVPGNGMVLRAACIKIFPGPVNVPEEAMYWTTTKDGMGNKLNGQHNYIMPSPNNSVLVIGRVFVENDSDLTTAYKLTKQIGITPLAPDNTIGNQ